VTHSDVRRSMPDYLEGDLPLDRRALFDAHLDECAECAREIAEMRFTISALRRLPDPEPPPTLVDDVMRRIRLGEGEIGWSGRLGELVSALFAPRILAPASAALLVAGIVLGTAQVREALEAQAGADGTVTLTIPLRMLIQDGSPDASGNVQPTVTVQNAFPGDGRRDARSLAWAPTPPREIVDLLPGDVRAVNPNVTPGQELIALNELMTDGSFRDGRVGGWPNRPSPRMSGEPVSAVSVASRAGTGAYGDLLLAPSPVMSGLATDSSRRWPTADEWLDRLQQSPAEFADWMASRTLAEQEHWVESLARRAVEQGRLDDVIASLRASESRIARVLADDFAAAGSEAGGSSVTARSSD